MGEKVGGQTRSAGVGRGVERSVHTYTADLAVCRHSNTVCTPYTHTHLPVHDQVTYIVCIWVLQQFELECGTIGSEAPATSSAVVARILSSGYPSLCS